VWLPSLDDRALRERLKRRMQLVHHPRPVGLMGGGGAALDRVRFL
jgi:hypothetical protein